MKRTILLTAVVIWAILSTASVQAATITVKADSTGDYPTIQAAINAAAPGDTVVLNPGLYQGNGNRDIDFGGKAITVTGTNPSDPCVVAATVIDCQGTEAQPHRGFYFHSGEGPDSILDGLTITNGYGSVSPGDYYGTGGAISCEKSSPAIKNCLIKNNKGSQNYPESLGGGIYTHESNSVITGCLFIENSAWAGGGIFNVDSNSTLIDCQFISNNADEAGGGICNNWYRLRPQQRGEMNGRATLINCLFKNNSSQGPGGGFLEMSSGLISLTDCTFTGNTASSGGGMYGGDIFKRCVFINNSARSSGGALYCSNTELFDCLFRENRTVLERWDPRWGGGAIYITRNATLVNCIFQRNTTKDSGGAINHNGDKYDDPLTLENCRFTDNKGGYFSGGIFNYEGTVIASNCLFNGNKAEQGGGITNYFPSAKLTLNNCTLTGNWATADIFLGYYGGAINDTAENNTKVTNCIIRNNIPDQIDVYPHSAGCRYLSYSMNYTNIQDLCITTGAGNIDQDPMFVNPGHWDNNGTPADNDDDFWVDGDYHLLSGSPSVNTGDPGYSPAPGETDLDGNPRILEGRVDMGCYETLSAIPTVINIVPETLNTKSQGRWITCKIKTPAGYTVADIVKDSIKLADLVPAQHVQANPGLQQLTMKFDRLVVIDTLILQEGLDRNGGFNIFANVKVTGELNDGKTFEGTDKIRFMHNVHTP